MSRTATTIEMDVGAGRIGVPVSSVLRVEDGRSALQEYEERAGRLAPGGVDGWVALGRWASGAEPRDAGARGMRARPQRVPGDARANEALGHVQVGGRWVTEDEGYRAGGFVKFEGEWITPAEHETILRRKRTAEAAKHEQRQEADARAREAEARAQEAEARAREAEADARRGDRGAASPVRLGRGSGRLAHGTDRHHARPARGRR